MTAEEFMKTWKGISDENRYATFYHCETVFKFANDYAFYIHQLKDIKERGVKITNIDKTK